MIPRLSQGVLALAVAALLAAPAFPGADLSAQSRFRILVPDFFAMEDADNDFGEDVAEELRDLLNELPTHAPIDKDEIEDNLDKFDMDMEELDCIRTRQLASQINAQVALCADYTEQGDQRAVKAAFWDMANSESFELEPFTIHKDQKEQAAQRIFDQFDQYVQLLRFQAFCEDYAGSQQWENALRNCNQALELNPSAVATRYRKARVLFETDRLDESYEELQKVLEANPYHEEALQLAGYVAIQQDDAEAGREYYSQYLQINPDADAVRMKIAYDMAQAGDPYGAAQLVAEGLESSPDNAGLLEYHGSYMFSAAQQRRQEQEMMPQPADSTDSEAGAGISSEVAGMYREAIGSLEKAYEIRGDSMSVGHLRNIVAAYMQLDEFAQAETLAARAVETHPEEAALWAVYADALQRQGKLDQAIETLGRVEDIDPEYQNLYVRQGNWLLEAGRPQDAIPYFKQAVERGQDANTVARLVFADAHNNGVKRSDWNYALRGIAAAKEFDVNAQTKAELDFWHGYVLYNQGMAIQEPQTLETANRSKPIFERARQFLQASKPYADSQPSINLSQFLNAVNTYIEIQDAIIKRGR